jgi:aminotransferase in exopolysaccharide biosynthesis
VNLAEVLVAILEQVLGKGHFPLHEPRFNGNEQSYLRDCVDSTFVSSVGEYVNRFESMLASYTGSKRAVATVNGTTALQLSLRLVGVEPGHEVLMPTLSFVATANAASYLGALPHFLDNEDSTLGLDAAAARDWLVFSTERTQGALRNKISGRRVSAIVVMHTFGHPSNLEDLLALSHDFNLVLVEDAAESLGSFYQGQHTGTLGRVGALSFNGNKIVTCGGGGAILTNDDRLADYAKHLSTTAKLPHAWEYVHDEIGYNFRLPNLNAALGCAQLEQLREFLDSKKKLTNAYQSAIQQQSRLMRKSAEAGLPIRLLLATEGSDCNYWLQTILLSPSVDHLRDDILAATNAAGYKTRPAWNLLHTLEPYKNAPRAPLPVAESLWRRIINLPSSAGLV